MVVSNKLLIFATSHGLGKSSRMIYNKKRRREASGWFQVPLGVRIEGCCASQSS